MKAQTRKGVTAAQYRALEALRADIQRVDCDARRTQAGPRIIKVWEVGRAGSRLRVRSVAGYLGHPFDDIERTITIGPRGGLSGWRLVGHGERSGGTRRHRGPDLLYAMDAEGIF